MQKADRDVAKDTSSLSKPVLLGLVAAVVVGVGVPLVVPHITHPSMIFHIALHIASMTIAVFLSIVSFLAYRRAGGARSFLMMLGFIALVGAEMLYFLDATGNGLIAIPDLNIEPSHVIVLAMLGLFGMGVLKVNH